MTTKPTRTTRVPGEAAAAPAGDDAATVAAAPQEAPAPSAPPAPGELPNAIDIDAKTIRGPVLTKQGWVCPDETGRRPTDALKV